MMKISEKEGNTIRCNIYQQCYEFKSIYKYKHNRCMISDKNKH